MTNVGTQFIHLFDYVKVQPLTSTPHMSCSLLLSYVRKKKASEAAARKKAKEVAQKTKSDLQLEAA